jgi:hypothetical protein
MNHYNQIHQSKNTCVIQAPGLESKCTCPLVKIDKLINLNHFKNHVQLKLVLLQYY